jgi:hypothetical protein
MKIVIVFLALGFYLYFYLGGSGAKVTLIEPPYAENSAAPDCHSNYTKFREFLKKPEASANSVNLYCSCVTVNLDVLIKEEKPNMTEEEDAELLRRAETVQDLCEKKFLQEKK